MNAAYVVIGLLYGGGDFTKTMEITTRCGQDADCNPSSSGGILGTVLGYDKIPAYWKQGLKEAEEIDFKYTTMSLNDVYAIGIKHALANIQNNGGKIEGEKISIKQQAPVPVRFERSFEGSYPIAKIPVKWTGNKEEINFDFEGTGFVIRGNVSKWDNKTDFFFKTQLYVDSTLVESPTLPVSFTTRRHEMAWKYDLPKGKHAVRLKILNPSAEFGLRSGEAIIYLDKPVNGLQQTEKASKSFAKAE